MRNNSIYRISFYPPYLLPESSQSGIELFYEIHLN